MNLTISAPSIRLSISMLFHILHTLPILTGPNIFLNICLSKMRRLYSSFAFKVQSSSVWVTNLTTINSLCFPQKKPTKNIKLWRMSNYKRLSKLLSTLFTSAFNATNIKPEFFVVYSYYIEGIHKRMVRFQKLTRNLFLTLHGHNVHRQQWQLSKFLMRYQ